MSLKDNLLGLLIICVWGFNFVVIAWGLEGLPPLLMGGLRFLLVAMIGCWFVKRPEIPFRWLAMYAMSLGFGQFAFLFTAMAVGMPAGLASLVLQSQALFTLLFASLLLKERIHSHQLLAIMVAGIGLALIGAGKSVASSGHTIMTGLGFGLTLAAAALWALGNIVNRHISESGYKLDLGLVVWSAWIPPLPFFLVSLFVEGGDTIVGSLLAIQWQSIIALLYLAVVATIIGYGLWSYLLGRYPVSQVAPLTLGVPVVGLSSAAVLLNEAISLLQWVGILLVLIGLVINVLGKRIIKPRPIVTDQ